MNEKQRKPRAPHRVGSYKYAILWIAMNDDLLWLDDDEPSASVTLCLVADVFSRSVEEATADLRRAIENLRREEERSKRAEESLEQARSYVRSVLDQTANTGDQQ